MDQRLREKLAQIATEYNELERKISDPQVINSASYRDLCQRHTKLQKICQAAAELNNLQQMIVEEEELLQAEDDVEMRTQLTTDLQQMQKSLAHLTSHIRVLLHPEDKEDVKNAIVEIRAGTGGDESALFAADLFRMYSRYAEDRKWKITLLDTHPTSIYGFKAITFVAEGKGAYGRFRYESGVHRVQRVPKTESSGRIHTSTATVAVFPEAEEVEIKIDSNEIKIETFRSTGPGGQSVNTTDSAVRLTHIPTGISASCQDEKSQLRNKLQAMRILRSRIKDFYERQKEADISAQRRKQIGSGERSEKIRTYNFPQNRATDHRIGLTLHQLETILAGDLDPLIDRLIEATDEASWVTTHS
ncbi:peptide chain release factor 1 [Candidatus Acetothermia bacterium]|jgi:peptide chain release factor 1|nr:peptide chain release factor 1 [Candidatus Acetothermia bacterium]MCI2427510.1 peptide chain release factor 1 [Candidatus Acetothermia bacterium]MCI2428123.1 peptide chain release factor 1 [Candidatus Acetothermia bacterium]